MSSLRIATWNINGLTPNKQEVEIFVNHKKIDILLLSETHLTNERVIKIKGYNIYYANHPDGTSHGGAAVMIKENLKHHASANFKDSFLQASVISVDDWNGPLTVAAVYCPPRHRINERMFTDFFCTLGDRFLLEGIGIPKTLYGALDSLRQEVES
jgi:exonuclease III